MSEHEFVQKYLVKDAQGNVYGPADPTMLRQWVLEGRIVAGMWIAEQETRAWMESSQHPAVADMLQVTTEAGHEEKPGGGGEGSVEPGKAGGQGPLQPVEDHGTGELELKPAEERPARPAGALSGIGAVGESRGGLLPRKAEGAGQVEYASPARMNVLGLISFIAGIGGTVMSCGVCVPMLGPCILLPLAGLLQVAAVTTGGVALYQMKLAPTEYNNRGFAMAGTVIGGVMIGLYMLLIVAGAVFRLTHR